MKGDIAKEDGQNLNAYLQRQEGYMKKLQAKKCEQKEVKLKDYTAVVQDF